MYVAARILIIIIAMMMVTPIMMAFGTTVLQRCNRRRDEDKVVVFGVRDDIHTHEHPTNNPQHNTNDLKVSRMLVR